MKKITLLLICLIGYTSYGQVNISENFEGGLPTGWDGGYSVSSSFPCDGSTARKNIYSSGTEGSLTTNNLVGASNGTDLDINFDYKIVDYDSGTFGASDNPTAAGWGTASVEYSTDAGVTWTSVLLIDDANHVVSNTCAPMMVTIPGASLPDGSDVQLQIINTYSGGDYYFYVDNLNAAQQTSTPPNCDATLTLTEDVGVEGNISWDIATGIPTGYNLTVGSSSGAFDILATSDVGLVTNYSLGSLEYSTTYYVIIEPFNDNGTATGCVEQTFVTEDAPPAGTDCNNPLIVASLPYNASDNTANYGDDYSGSPGASGCGTTSFYLNGDDVVYAYAATSDTSINVALSSIGSTYSGVFVYTDCADIGSACVAGVGNGSSTANYDFDVEVTNGTNYYIVISTWATPQSTTYTLDITENTCTSATVAYSVISDCDISGGFNIEVDITDMGTATDLTVSDDQASPTQSATGTTTLTFGPYVNGTDVVITVVDDNDANCTLMSGALTQNTCPLPNDTCFGAINVACDETVTGDTSADGVTDTVGNASADLWYSYSGGAGDITASLCNSSYDTNIIVYDSCGGTVLASNDDSCGALSEVTFAADGVSTYYIAVEGYATAEGAFEMTITCLEAVPPPVNDAIADAIVLVTAASQEGTTAGASENLADDKPNCDLFGNIADVWFTYTQPENTDTMFITTTISGTSSEANCAIYASGAPILSANELACGDDGGASGEMLQITATPGVTYYIRVWSDGVAPEPEPPVSGRVEGTFNVTANASLSTNEFDNPSAFTYYPNPVKNTLILNAQNNIENVKIFNMLGQEVMNAKPQTLNSDLNMSNLETGTYFVKVTIANVTKTVRVIKQ